MVILTKMSEIQEQPVRWLWKNYIPCGMLTLLVGEGGSGKSTLAFDFAATLSIGGLWPDKSRAEVGSTFIWSSEDSVEQTIKPRLMAMGADMENIYHLGGSYDDYGLPMPFDPSRDMEKLSMKMQQLRAKGVSCALLIIDPIVSAVAGDMHRGNVVRRSLQPVVDLASEHGSAVIGITHFAKNTGGRNPGDRVLGSVGFVGFARMVLATGKDKQSDRRVITRIKSNHSEEGGGFEYTLEQKRVREDIEASHVVWGESVLGSAISVLSEVEGEAVPSQGKKEEQAKKFLSSFLAGGSKPKKEVFAAASLQSISEITLRRAAKAMGILKSKMKGTMDGPSMWELAS